MRRRALILSGGALIALRTTYSRAQTANPRRIAFFHPGNEEGMRRRLGVFRDTLKELKYVEGRDIVLEVQWGAGRTSQIAATAAAIVARKPDLIVTASSAGVAAFQKATSSIPIVFATAGDPVGQGFVASLRRPGGNITGVAVFIEMGGKIIEVGREALPQARRFAILAHTPDPAHKFWVDRFVASAPRFNFEPIVVRVERPLDLEDAFKELRARKADALYLADVVFNLSNHEQIVERSLRARLPLLSSNHEVTEAGGLLSYGSPRDDNYRKAAILVDKILRGARPSELPVEQPERIELMVNLKTARAIGAKLPREFVQRADRIID